MPSRTGSADLPLYHGGKDGHPYPVPLRVYDETIRVLTEAAQRAKLGNADRLAAIERLDAQARSIERAGRDLEFGGFVAEDRRLSAQYGGAYGVRSSTSGIPVSSCAAF